MKQPWCYLPGYWHPALSFTPRDSDVDLLLRRRVEAIQEREYWLKLQKEMGQLREIEHARFCREQAADCMKRYRAVCLVLPFFAAELPKDCKYSPARLWPEELREYLDLILGEISCGDKSS